MITRLLIANRGEIACRIMRTAKHQGLTCAVLFSEDECNALHVRLSDEAYSLGTGPLNETYLNQDKIIVIAKQNKIDAIHPGYGFLSENPEFSKKCSDAGIVFVGPSHDAIAKMGIKSVAKNWVQALQLPTIPGYQGEDQSIAHLTKEALQIGLPVLIKASSGGGGKGMRIVHDKNQLQHAIEGAKRESQQSFGSSHVIIEKYFENAFHIEVQIFGDYQGNVVHLFERNCSIQRRHQKIIEEAPATMLSAQLKAKMYEAAVSITRSLQYVGAGTIEFLVANDQFYFMEMNTRLQVEHPVTEMVTGVDLVAWQLSVANGQALPLRQDQITLTGHAIEARVYCEDPLHDFLPTAGTIRALQIKENQNVRIETGIQIGDTIGIRFDPMLAKVIAWGENRQAARLLLKRALADYQITGPVTNLNFLQTLLNHPDFITAQPPTHFIGGAREALNAPQHDQNLVGALGLVYWLQHKSAQTFSFWRLNHPYRYSFEIEVDKAPLLLTAEYQRAQNIWLFKEQHLVISLSDKQFQLDSDIFENEISLHYEGYHYLITLPSQQMSLEKTKGNENGLLAPMPGVIREIFVKQGSPVELGEKMLIMEAMKMEHTIAAPHQGIVKQIFYKIGDQVSEGSELLEFESAHD